MAKLVYEQLCLHHTQLDNAHCPWNEIDTYIKIGYWFMKVYIYVII